MKKLLSVILTAVMLFTVAMPAFAASEKADYNGNPVVIVRGINFTSIKFEDGSGPFNISTGTILGVLLESVITKFALKNEDALYDAFAEIVTDIFEPIAYDKNCESVNELSAPAYTKSLANYPNYGHFNDAEGGLVREAVKRYGAENVYLFSYDWRKSAKQLAGELSALIDTAKEASGKKQVDIICASMGCMITTAYFTYHGYDSVNKAVYVSGAHNGVYALGDAFSGHLSINTETVRNTVDSLIGDNFFAKVLINVFDWLGAIDFLTEYLNKWVNDNYEKANDDVFRDCFGCLPGYWALCPDDRFDEAYETVFGDCEDEYAAVCEVVKETGDFIKGSDEVIAGAYKAGIEISFIANYNVPAVPVYESAVLNGDGTIETVLASNGATVAPYGKTLSGDEITDEAYLSADRVIDASTAAYKDYTWFIRNGEHVATDYGTDCNAFVFWLFECENQPTIRTDERYPQFLVTDSSWSLAPLK